MNPDQQKAYNFGYQDGKSGKAALDSTNVVIMHFNEWSSQSNINEKDFYNYYMKGYNQAKLDLNNPNPSTQSTPPFPSDETLRGVVIYQFNRIKRSYTEQDLKNWIQICKTNWNNLGSSANLDRLVNKIKPMFDSLPPEPTTTQQQQQQQQTQQQVTNAIQSGNSDSINAIVSSSLSGSSSPTGTSVKSVGIGTELYTGTYKLTTVFDLQASLLQEANQLTLGNAAVNALQSLAAQQKELVLPIANKRVKILSFSSSDVIPVIQKSWQIEFEVLEDYITAGDVVTGFATLAGVNPSLLANSIIEKRSATVSGVVGTTSSPILIFAIVAVVILAVVKLAK